MNYYYLKLGAGNEEAESRLGAASPTAAVFFDDLSEAEYKAGRGKTQARVFWERGKPENRKTTTMVVIFKGRIWLLEPASEVSFSKPDTYPSGHTGTVKEMAVKLLWQGWCKDVPPVIAGIGSSQHHGRRTFTRIQHWGNLKAIDCVLQREGIRSLPQATHWDAKQHTAAQLLECLGSTELETLVGKLFEAHDCHVPAYLGGTLRDIDIFAYNDSAGTISVGSIKIPPASRISIQVKTWSQAPRSEAVDYLIGLDAVGDNRTFDAGWLLARVKECEPVLRWMQRSLSWLPKDYQIF